MRSRIIIRVVFYAYVLVANVGAIWFVGDLNTNKWVAPSIALPAWLFGLVWTTLYLLISSSGYRLSYRTNRYLKSIAPGVMGISSMSLHRILNNAALCNEVPTSHELLRYLT